MLDGKLGVAEAACNETRSLGDRDRSCAATASNVHHFHGKQIIRLGHLRKRSGSSDPPFPFSAICGSSLLCRMIEVRHLTKTFKERKRGQVHAVENISLTVQPGQIYGLLGANGAGKTTTLRMLATLLKPSGGEAVVAGHDVMRAPEKVRSQVGFLAVSTALYGRLTAREMISYFGRLNGLQASEIARRTDLLATSLDMHDFLDRRCETFSTGMKQKTSIARTLIHDPAVMIFDEPTHGLDVMAARRIVQFVRECGQRGKTVIYSTHVMSEVEKLCDRIGIIHNGKLLAEGTLAELRERYNEQDMEEIFVKVVGEGGV